MLNHIKIDVPAAFPDELVNRFRKELETQNLNLDIRKLPTGGPYASLEWAIPTLIAVYILKPYFEGFLNEMGKEHYNILKNWLQRNSESTRLIKVTTVVAKQSSNKINAPSTQSKVFSINSITNEGHKIKFLFDENFEPECWNIGIKNAMNILEKHFTNGQSDELTIEIKSRGLERSIYAKLKNEKGEWEFLDYKTININSKNKT